MLDLTEFEAPKAARQHLDQTSTVHLQNQAILVGG